MQCVIDKNVLRNRGNRLKQFLDEGHQAIIIDEILVESFKSNDPYGTIAEDFKILKHYPQSVFTTYSRSELFRKELETGRPSLPHEIICTEYTDTLRSLLTLDDTQLREKIYEDAKHATTLIDDNSYFSEEFIRGLLIKNIDLDWKSLKTDKHLIHETIKKASLSTTKQLLLKQGKAPFVFDDFIYTKSMIYIVIYALIWDLVRWGIKRGFESAKHKVISADGFDLRYIALSCYFDGLLTNERWLEECRESTLLSYA